MATIQVADKPTLDRIETKVDSIKADTGFSTIAALPEEISVSAPDTEWRSVYKVTGAGEICIRSMTVRSDASSYRHVKINVDGTEIPFGNFTSGSVTVFSPVKFLKSFEIFAGHASTLISGKNTDIICTLLGFVYM